MNNVLTVILTAVCSILASSGFWAFMQSKNDKKDVQSEMLLGLGHDRIVNLCQMYIERGYITNDEYENLMYLYKPYTKMGGNGSAERAMNAVNKLPMNGDRHV